MNNQGAVPLYNDLLAIIKEIVQLRTRMTTKPTMTDAKNYKLLIKCFEAYTRIKQHPEIELDTIKSVVIDGAKPDGGTTVKPMPLERKSEGKGGATYLFIDNAGDGPKIDSTDDDSDTEPNDLFLTEPSEPLPDDSEVKQMLKKSEYQLQRAVKHRNYLAVTELSGSDSDKSNEGGSEKKERECKVARSEAEPVVPVVPVVPIAPQVPPALPELPKAAPATATATAPDEPIECDATIFDEMKSMPQRTRRNALAEVPGETNRPYFKITPSDDDEDIYHTPHSVSYNSSQKNTPHFRGYVGDDEYYD